METDHRGREVWHQRLFRIINSAICFSLAYIILTQSFWMTMGMVGKLFRFDAFVYYYGIKFMLHEHYWNRLNVGLIYSSGGVMYLVVGLLGLSLFDRLKTTRSIFSVFFLWLFVAGTSMFCAQFVIASLGYGLYNSPFYQSFSVVFSWVRIPIPVVYMLIFPVAVLLAYFSINSCKPFLSMASSYTKVNKLSRRRRFYIETVAVPFLIGTLITTVLTFPLNIFLHVVQIAVTACFLFVGWYALSYVEIMRDDVLKFKSLQTLSPLLMLSIAAVIAAVVITWGGIYLAYH